MRLLLLTDRAWPAIGGVEDEVRLLGRELAARGHRVSVLCLAADQRRLGVAARGWAAPAPSTFTADGMTTRVLGATLRQRLLTLPMAVRSIPVLEGRAYATLAGIGLPFFRAAHQGTLDRLAAAADLVHDFGAQELGATGLRAARRAGVPFAITPYVHPGHWGDDPLNVATYRAADLALGLHEQDREVLVGLGVDRARTAVLPVVVAPLPPVAAHDEGLPYALFLGRVNAYKGIGRLFAAWPRVHAATGARLLVAGPAEEPLDPPPGVRLLGVVGEAEKAALLAGAALLALPSQGELVGKVVLEAWSAGTPVVVSRAPVLAALVRDGEDGLVSEGDPEALAAALAGLLSDPARAARMGQAGRLRVGADHSPVAVADLLEAHYRGLAARPAATRAQ